MTGNFSQRGTTLDVLVASARADTGAAVLLLFVLAGCSLQHYRPQPVVAAATAQQFEQRTFDDPRLADFVHALDVPEQAWPPQRWNMRSLFLAALFFQPDLDVARSDWRTRVAEVQAAGRRPPLVLNPALEHHSQPDGGSPWTFGSLFDVVIPGPGKRAARIDAALAQARQARLGLGERAWQLHTQVHDKLVALAAQRRQKTLAAKARDQTAQALHLLERRQALGVIGNPGVARVRLRLQQARLAAARADSNLRAARLDLAGVIGVPLAAFAAIEDRLAAPRTPLPDAAPANADALRAGALRQRYDVRAALAGYAEAEAKLREAIANQYPDVTLSPGFLFDQADQVWVLDASLPLLLAGHNDGPIAAARAERTAAAARFRAVQAGAITGIQRAVAAYAGRLQVLATANHIVAAQRRHQHDIDQRLQSGYADRLALVNTTIETISARQARLTAEADARQARAALAGALQNTLGDDDSAALIDRFVALGVGALTADKTRDDQS